MKASSSYLSQDQYVHGSDGTLIAEFRAMEQYHRLAIEEDSYSSTQDSFPCHTLNNRHYMACLDIGGAGTFSGNTTTPAIDWEVAADAQWYKNVSRDHLNASTLSGRNLFGVTCGGGDNTVRHGDGVINSFDIGVLIFVLFGDYPYNNIDTYAAQLTVEQRPETQSRCGNDEDRASWQGNLHLNNFCPSTGSARRMLQHAADEGDAQTYEDISQVGAVGPANGWEQGTHHMNHEFVRTRFRGHNSEGSWHSFEFAPTIVPVIVELILHGVWSTGSAVLSNAPPPETGQEVPMWPERYQVRWSRTKAQSQFAEAGTECNAIVTGATGTQTLIGDTLSVRQEGRGSNCPFWLHLWTPVYAANSRPVRRLSDRALALPGGQWPGRTLSESDADLRTVWAKRGSSAMTTMGPVILNPSLDLEFGTTPPLPQPPPSPPTPPSPPPPLSPPPAQVKAVRVSQDFSIAGAESVAIVDDLRSHINAIEEAVQQFVSDIISAEVLISVNVDSLHNESSGSAIATGAPVSRARRRLVEATLPESCDNGARLEVLIRFATFVEVDVVEQVKDEWSHLVNDSLWNTTACNEPTFDTEVATPGPADVPNEDHTVITIALSVGGATLFCCCVVVLVLFTKKCGKRDGNNNNVAAKKKYRSPKPYTKVTTKDDLSTPTSFNFQSLF